MTASFREMLCGKRTCWLFGQAKGLGETIHLHNQFGDLAVKVVGITADPPDQSDIHYQYLFSSHILENRAYTEGSDWAKLTAWGNDYGFDTVFSRQVEAHGSS